MSQDMFRFCDDIGPEKILHFHNSSTGLKAILVVDNLAAGPAIGGTRMAPDVTVEECFRLARAMTLKNAAAGLPHGGAKAVIIGDPAMPADRKEQVIRSFAQAIGETVSYIPGPDMGTDETAMAWIRDETGRSVGLPREIGGIPLDELGATGFGLAAAGDVAQDFSNVRLEGARVVVQGFGSVGMHAARFLAQRGAVLVGASDSRTAIVNPGGLDVEALMAHKHTGERVGTFAGGMALDDNDVIGVPCDIWIPAARPDVIRDGNADRLDCKLILEGANIPASAEVEKKLHDRGILVVTDFIANAGGVICASAEYHGMTQTAAFQAIEEKIRFNTRAVLEIARREGIPPREAADRLAEERLRAAMKLRRWHI